MQYLFQGHPVRVQMGIAIAVTYINHLGGTKHQAALKETCLKMSETHIPALLSVHILGVDSWQENF